MARETRDLKKWLESFSAGGAWRKLDAVPDVADRRDQLYQPALITLRSSVEPWKDAIWWNDGRVRDQALSPSCVGHALAAVIDHLRAQSLIDKSASEVQRASFAAPYVSWKMLYSTARFHDEFAGEGYKGSSVRGGLKGFFYNGVCSLEEEMKSLKPDLGAAASGDDFPWYMTRDIAESARTIQLGAYYRVRPRLPDIHAALNEAHVLLVSAYVHDGWQAPQGGKIVFDMNPVASDDDWRPMHAFAVVGYNGEGLWVQNSWGAGWGEKGRALWAYEDWAANFCDAWVLRLGLLPPNEKASASVVKITAYGGRIDRQETHFLDREKPDAVSGPSRLDVLGHMLPCREGRLDEFGPYNTNFQTLRETYNIIGTRLREPQDPPSAGSAGRLPSKFRYEHVLLYFMGGWPDEGALAMQLAEVIPVFKRQGIYPLFLVWDHALFNELELLVRRVIEEVRVQSQETTDRRRAVRDRNIERQLADPGNRLLRQIRQSALRMFKLTEFDPDAKSADEVTAGETSPASGAQKFVGACLDELFETLDPRYRNGTLSYHLAAHGFGAQVAVEWLAHDSQRNRRPCFQTAALLSPLIAIERARRDLVKAVLGRGEGAPSPRARAEFLSIGRLDLFLLDQKALKLDRFSDDYGGAWPELWARVRALDMEVFDQKVQAWSGQGQVLSMLAVMEHARKLWLETDANIRVLGIRAREDEADSSLHHELGLNRVMLDWLVRDILRLSDDTVRYFSNSSRKITIIPEERHPAT